jgi:RNA polymerase sigma factor (TIGR02999 family)
VTDHVVDQGFERTPDELRALLAGLYDQCHAIALRLMFHENHSEYDADDLTHDTMITLFNSGLRDIRDVNHLLAIFSRAARRRLVDRARERRSLKRGGAGDTISLNDCGDNLCTESISEMAIAIDEALEKLSHFNSRQMAIVKLKYYAGYTDNEIANELGINARSVRRNFVAAIAYLSQLLYHTNSETADTETHIAKIAA